MNESKLTSTLKSKIDSRLQRIANVLLLNASFIDNLGLLNGKMGIAIFFYQYARYTSSKIFEDYAGELIDEIYEEINTNTPVDFENGLTGIGWGIEYLVKNRFLEADTDEILEDIDKKVYQKIQIELDSNELAGFLLYQLARFKSKKNRTGSKELLLKHIILCLLGECEKLLVYRKFESHDNFPDLSTLKIVQYFLSEADKAGLFPEKTKILLDILPSFIEIAMTNKETEKETIVDRATALVLQRLCYPSEIDLNTDINSMFLEAFKFIDDEDNWKSYLLQPDPNNLGFKKGLSGIGMTMLRILSDLNSQHLEVLKTNNTTATQSGNNLSIFIFKSNARGMQYGMGTYIRELTEALLVYTGINIYIITYHSSEFNEFSIEVISERYFKVNIPSPKLTFLHNNSSEKKYASAVVNLLADVISKNEEIVFQMNYIDDSPIIKKLKEKYTHPIISVVHFSQWEQLFNGNKQKLNGLNLDIPANNIEFTIFREKEMYQFSDHIISINRFMKDFIVEEYGILPDKISIVKNGINFSRFPEISQGEKLKLKHNLGFNSHEKIILFSGRIDPDKGIFFLIDAFIDACKYMEDLRLVLIGQGKIQECLQKCQLFYGKITFTGFLSPEKVMSFYQIADVGVVPSIYEPCSYTRLEMIANKIPLILSRIDGFSDMFEDNQCMFIDPIVSADGEISFNNKEFSNAILSLARDDQMAENLALNAYKNLVIKFSVSRMAEEMNNLYHTLIKSNKMTLEYEKN